MATRQHWIARGIRGLVPLAAAAVTAGVIGAGGAEASVIVDWGGAGYVSADMSFARAVDISQNGVELGGGGATPSDDRLRAISFSMAAPLNPTAASGYDTAASSAVFYGGVRWHMLNNGAFGDANLQRLVDERGAGVDDWLFVGNSKSNATLSFAAIAWAKEDFAGGGAGAAALEFDPADTLSMTVSARSGNTRGHFLVKDNGQWYVSSSSKAGTGLFEIADPDTALWGLYNPSGGDIVADFAQTFTTHTFTSIEAVGYYVHTTAAGGDPNFGISRFTASATAADVPEPAAVGLGMAGLVLLVRRRR